jgi:hypothetical protein
LTDIHLRPSKWLSKQVSEQLAQPIQIALPVPKKPADKGRMHVWTSYTLAASKVGIETPHLDSRAAFSKVVNRLVSLVAILPIEIDSSEWIGRDPPGHPLVTEWGSFDCTC